MAKFLVGQRVRWLVETNGETHWHFGIICSGTQGTDTSAGFYVMEDKKRVFIPQDFLELDE